MEISISLEWQPVQEKENWIPNRMQRETTSLTIFPKNAWEFIDNKEKEAVKSHDHLRHEGALY